VAGEGRVNALAEFRVDMSAITPEQLTQAYKDAHSCLEVVESGFRFAKAGDLRAKLDWEIDRFGRAMAILELEGCPLFRFRVEVEER
jgi:hypothetical protein